jgi:hypothetical protein
MILPEEDKLFHNIGLSEILRVGETQVTFYYLLFYSFPIRLLIIVMTKKKKEIFFQKKLLKEYFLN